MFSAAFVSLSLPNRDPLSPHIFMLCIKRLFHLINWVVDQKIWCPIQISRDGLHIAHLAFAYDLLLFAKANVDQAKVIKYVLKSFCDNSGQKVSEDKTIVFFSRNVSNALWD